MNSFAFGGRAFCTALAQAFLSDVGGQTQAACSSKARSFEVFPQRQSADKGRSVRSPTDSQTRDTFHRSIAQMTRDFAMRTFL